MKIYENANDQHVRKVVLYEVGAGLAFDEAGTELLTKEEIVDAFLKGCVVENEGNYKTPTGVNVTDSGAELVFGGGGSGGGGMVVTVDFDESFNGIADKALDEIIAAFDAGTFVSIKVLMVGAFYMQAPLVIDAYGEPGARDIEATLKLGEITLQCKSGTTWTAM